MAKKISAQAIFALKDALANIYWKKEDLRSFIYNTVNNKAIISTIDWLNNKKFESASQLIDRMVAREDIYFDDIMLLINAICEFDDFNHLRIWDDPEKKIARAKQCVESLRAHCKGHIQLEEEKKKIAAIKAANKERIAKSADYQEKLNLLSSDFQKIVSNSDNQQRGYHFEKFLNELFAFFDLDPKAAFKIEGEQIDGAFTFDGTDYLIEAKWQQNYVEPAALYIFGGKIKGKLKNTLGLFISFSGFSMGCIKSENPDLKSMILMDGQDLIQVLEKRISLNEMIYIKRRHAAQTGEILYRISNI